MEESSKEKDRDKPFVPAEPPAAVEPRHDVRAATSPVRCPFCHEDVSPAAADWVVCRGCLARHHQGCWKESGACASCRCPDALSGTARARRSTKRTVFAAVAGVVLAVFAASVGQRLAHSKPDAAAPPAVEPAPVRPVVEPAPVPPAVEREAARLREVEAQPAAPIDMHEVMARGRSAETHRLRSARLAKALATIRASREVILFRVGHEFGTTLPGRLVGVPSSAITVTGSGPPSDVLNLDAGVEAARSVFPEYDVAHRPQLEIVLDGHAVPFAYYVVARPEGKVGGLTAMLDAGNVSEADLVAIEAGAGAPDAPHQEEKK